MLFLKIFSLNFPVFTKNVLNPILLPPIISLKISSPTIDISSLFQQQAGLRGDLEGGLATITSPNYQYIATPTASTDSLMTTFKSTNTIYENEFKNLPPANKTLVGKIQNEHSIFYNGDDTKDIKGHNFLPYDILKWFENVFS